MTSSMVNLSAESVITIVVAKANSSRVPKKNFREFYNGLSLVDITLNLLNSSSISLPTILSTDQLDYSPPPNILLHNRSPLLSKVETPVLDVLLNIIDSFSISAESRIVLLQPTSPFRTSFDYEAFLNASSHCDPKSSLVSVYPVEDNHPARMYYLQNDLLVPVLPSQVAFQAQELPPCFHRNGCFYSFNVSDLLSGSLYSSSLATSYIMPLSSSINIDTVLDFNIAQFLYPQFLSGSSFTDF